jgi:hypothetical protein
VAQKGLSPDDLPYYIDENGEKYWEPFAWYDAETQTLYYFADITRTYEFAPNPKEFSDIDGHWGYEAIIFAAMREIFDGMGNDMFEPGTTLTRAMLTAVIARLARANLSGFGETSRFDDVAVGEWYTPYIEWAAENGLVEGLGDNKFEPDRAITREEMTALFDRFLSFMEFNLTKVNDAPPAFADIEKSWAKANIENLFEVGLLLGLSETEFGVGMASNRAQNATLVARLIELTIKSLIPTLEEGGAIEQPAA